MSSRPSSTSSSSSDVGVRRKSSSVRPSCRPKPVRRASTTRQTPSTSITTTKHRTSQGTSRRDPALCWGTITSWSWSKSSLFRGSSPPAAHAHQLSPQQEARRSFPDFWNSWSRLSWKKSQQLQLELLQVPRSPLRLPLVARTGHSPPTEHSVLENCSISASLKAQLCVWMGRSHQPRLLMLRPTGLTWTPPQRNCPLMSQKKENPDNWPIQKTQRANKYSSMPMSYQRGEKWMRQQSTGTVQHHHM